MENIKQLKALEILKNYRTIDFRCNNQDELAVLINEAIAELEDLIKSKSCEDCKYLKNQSERYLNVCKQCSNFYKSNFEAKE